MLATISCFRSSNHGPHGSKAAAADILIDAVQYRKKLAVAQGELEGYICKVDGFARALEELELQLAEKDLQVAMLKSVIADADNPTALELRLAGALAENRSLKQQLQTAAIQPAQATSAATPSLSQQQRQRRRWNGAGSCDSASQQQDCQSTQLLMLRKALTVANMRLTSNGLLPVAATSDLLQYTDVSESLRADQGVAFPAYTPADPPTASTAGAANTQGSTGAVPGLPALCLLKKLAALPLEGSRTPVSTDAERFVHNMSRCSTPVDAPTPRCTSDDGSETSVDDRAVVDGTTDASCHSAVTADVADTVSSLEPVAAAPSCSLRCTEADHDSSNDEDDGSVFGSELSDDYEYGRMQGYPDTEGCPDDGVSMQPPVLDNPLFLHDRPERNM